MYHKFDAVLFDCDGVLVDSEPITNGLLRDMLEEQGWSLTPEACFQHFVGKAVMDEKLAIEANTGKPLTEAWMQSFRARRNAALEAHLQAIPHIHVAIEQIHLNFEGRIACASGADRFKVELQLAKVELMPYFEGRIFSGHEMPRSKPAPDVYLAAAAAVGVHPSRCAVVEDTVTGVMAGVAAGCKVFGYAPPHLQTTEHAALLAAGASHTFTDMLHLPSLLSQKMAQLTSD
jgi:HAD superfamily hydrolase (TIGR01509 family)